MMEVKAQEQNAGFNNTFSYKLFYVFAIADNAHAGSCTRWQGSQGV